MPGAESGPTRALQIGFLVVLIVAVAQVAWWILDQRAYTLEVQESALELYAAAAALATDVAARGEDPAVVTERYPFLAFDSTTGAFVLAQDAALELADQRRSRLNQYGWEGAFFLIVLIACVGILGRLLQLDHQLRRRQRNFLAAVSHEFKSPLASLQLAVETLGLRPPTDLARERLAKRMLQDVNRLDVMVANILDTARLERGQVEVTPEPLLLAPEVARAVARMKPVADQREISLRMDVGHDLMVVADPVALQTVLSNLLDNALKAASRGTGGEVRISARSEDGHVAMAVADDGVGFEPSEGHRLFEQFYRPGDEMRREMPGTGLGLYIVRQMVELCDGRVRADSPGPGLGATVTVWWPVAARADA